MLTTHATWLLAAALAVAGAAPQEQTGRIEGRVVDEQGLPLPANWRISLRPVPPRSDAGVRHAQASEASPANFVLEDLEPGLYRTDLYQLRGEQRFHFWGHGPSVVVEEGVTAELEVVFAGIETASINVDIEGVAGLPFCAPAIESFVLSGQGRDDWPPDVLAGALADLVWRDLPAGVYDLAFEQEGYESWSHSGLVPGDTVVAELHGTCSLTLDVIDDRSSAPVDSFTVEGSVTNAAWTRDGWPWSRRGRLGTGIGGRLEQGGLVPGSYRLTVSSERFEDQVVHVVVGPAEPARVEARLGRSGSVVGRVLDEAGLPAAGVDVGLFSPAAEDSPEVWFHSRHTDWNLAQPGPWLRSERHAVTSDEEGAYRFEGVGPGPWILRAYRSPTVHVFSDGLVVGAGQSVEGGDLLVPLGCVLQGRIQGLEEDVYAALRVQAWPMAGEQPRAFPSTASVTAEGTFRVGPFGPGEVAVWLGLEPGWQPMVSVPGAYDPPPHLAATITIPAAGPVDLALDLGDSAPTYVAVRATLDGEPAAGMWVQLYDPDQGHVVATMPLDAAGSAMVGPFFAQSVRPALWHGEGWFVYGDDRITPPPGGVGTLAFDAHVARGELLLTSTSGEPLTGEVVCVYRSTPFGWWASLTRSDDAGRLELCHPETELAILHVGEAGARWLPTPGEFTQIAGPLPYPPEPEAWVPRVRWTRDGPSVTSLALPVSSR